MKPIMDIGFFRAYKTYCPCFLYPNNYRDQNFIFKAYYF